MLSSRKLSPHNAQGRVVTSLPSRAIQINPSDDTVFEEPTAVYVGAAGDISVVPFDGDNIVTLYAMQAGQIVPFCVKKVMLTGTSATNLVGAY